MQNTSRKEIIIAAIVGLSSGILAAYVLYNNSVRKRTTTPEKVKISTSTKNSVDQKSLSSKPVNQNNDIKQLAISSPNNNLVTTIDSIEIAGKAPKNSFIYISSEINDQVIQIKEQTDFKISIDLVTGENIINITNILNNGQEDRTNLTIIYDKQ